jgi:hypothetical protein
MHRGVVKVTKNLGVEAIYARINLWMDEKNEERNWTAVQSHLIILRNGQA